MIDPRDRLEEYADGLLPEADAEAVEAALAADAQLRAELDAVRRFRATLETLQPEERAVQGVLTAIARRRRRRFAAAWGAAAAAAAALLIWALAGGAPTHGVESIDGMQAEWMEFGRRLGTMATQRRKGLVPRIGFGDLEVPPARASGLVFSAALDEMRVPIEARVRRAVLDSVRNHAVEIRRLGADVAGEARRAEASLVLYRRLRALAGTPVADAYYDVFRPGLADLTTVRRVAPGTLAAVVADRREYVRAYQEAVALLARRYGQEQVRLVLDRLAPTDGRRFDRDAAQDGIGRDAVLSMRAHFYRVASDAGVAKLYVDL